MRSLAAIATGPLGRRLTAAGGVLAPSLWHANARAQATGYPNRPVRIVVPYPAGGGTDNIARMLATRLNEAWGQPIVVENRVGASGIIGNDAIAKAPADGYTLLLGITTLIQMPFLQAKLPYDAFKDFAPVSQLALSADLFAVPTSSPFQSLKDFVDHARARKGTVNYGSYGNGTSSHVHGEMLSAQANLGLVHVPFKGGAPLMTDLLGGQLNSAFVDLSSARAHLKSGKMRVLAITGERRFKLLPEVPTFTELGYKEFEPYGWFAMLAPAGTPADIVARVSTEVGRIIRLPEITARIEDMGLQAVGNSPAEFQSMMRRDHAIWGKVIRDANIRLD